MALSAMKDAAKALAFVHVRFGYHGEDVVRDVSLTVARGAMVGLLGPNGAGKSTLLKLASGILRPAAGAVSLDGAELRTLSQQEVARRVAVVPQDFAVQFAYTVRQIVELGRMPYLGSWGVQRAADRRAVIAALEETNTLALADRVFNELSGGERQRVLLALALAQDAGIVLLDEPTAHLDIKHQIEVLELLRHLNAERHLTVVAVLHDLNLAARYFPRLVLFQREIVADGPPAQVLDGALLSNVYGTAVQVGILRGEEHLSVLPPGYAVASDEQPAIPAKESEAIAHVIAGGGSGELLMRALADAKLPFSAGPLNIGDSDYVLALRLATLCIAEPPYAPVSPQGLEAARERMAAAAAVIICPTPLGPGNVALLEEALAARWAGAMVILLEPACVPLVTSDALNSVAERDFSGRGVALYQALADAGARWAGTPNEAVTQVQQAVQAKLA